MSLENCRLLSAGCDWITVTQEPGEKMDQLREMSLGLADAEMHNGMFGRPWSASGYEGFSCGHLEYGERHDGCIVQLHSHLSHAHWLRFFALARNVSRIDVEVTTATEEDPAFRLRRHLRQLQRHNRKLKRGPQLSYMVSHTGGMTIYSGSPQSDVRLRIYDKERESNQSQWSKAVRFEAQFRRGSSLRMARNMSSARSPGQTGGAAVRRILQNRGGSCRTLNELLRGSVSFETLQDAPTLKDVDRVCGWLRKSVQPSVQRLLVYTERAVVLEALGL